MVVVSPKKIARAIGGTSSNDHTSAQAKARTSSKAETPARATDGPSSIPPTPAPESEATHNPQSIEPTPPVDPVLFTIRQLGRTLDDIERLRIMNGNRVGAGQRSGIELPWMDAISAQLDALEHSVELELKRAWRKHPLAPWAKAIPGAGEVLMARLIAEIGAARIDKDTGEIRRAPIDAPNPGKLLAYCGHGDPARSGAIPKGATQEELFKRGSPAAKKATWKLAYQFMRTVGSDATKPSDSNVQTRRSPRSPYRDIYDERKADTVGRLHEKACKRCGPAGKPALPGSPWSDAHRHADALRIVGKRFLIDLWIANKEARA